MRRFATAILISSLILGACGGGENGIDESDTGAVTTAPDGTGAPTVTDAPGTTIGPGPATTVADLAGIGVLETDLGTILVDADGFALYLFTPDPEEESTCTNACADNWPPLPPTEVGDGLDGSMFAVIDRPDGGQQMTVNGHPVYRFSGDSPGDTNGHGINGVWFVVNSEGDGIVAPAALAPDDGYDY